MKETENEETDTKVLYAPTQFYDDCDDCDTLPEERWKAYRQKLDEEKKKIIEGRERVLSYCLITCVCVHFGVFFFLLGFTHR